MGLSSETTQVKGKYTCDWTVPRSASTSPKASVTRSNSGSICLNAARGIEARSRLDVTGIAKIVPLRRACLAKFDSEHMHNGP